jgi:hypothetical protein
MTKKNKLTTNSSTPAVDNQIVLTAAPAGRLVAGKACPLRPRGHSRAADAERDIRGFTMRKLYICHSFIH